VAVGEEHASEVMKHLSPTEAEALSLEIAKAPKFTSEVCHAVIEEAVENVLGEQYLAEGGVDYARAILERSLGPEKAAEIVGRLAATIERRPFEFLRRTPPEQIHVFLRSESPQTIALVIANLHTTLAAQVLAMLEPAHQAEVAPADRGHERDAPRGRRAGRGRRARQAVERQRAGLRGGRRCQVARRHPQQRRPQHRAQRARRAGEGERSPRRGDPAAAVHLRGHRQARRPLDPAGAQGGRPEGPRDRPARRGDDVAARIFSNLSERGAELLREEIQFQPPQRKRVVEECQGRIVGVVRRLEEAGAIVLSRGMGAEDQLV
jgi:flagellar motor switch protein FliG